MAGDSLGYQIVSMKSRQKRMKSSTNSRRPVFQGETGHSRSSQNV